MDSRARSEENGTDQHDHCHASNHPTPVHNEPSFIIFPTSFGIKFPGHTIVPNRFLNGTYGSQIALALMVRIPSVAQGQCTRLGEETIFAHKPTGIFSFDQLVVIRIAQSQFQANWEGITSFPAAISTRAITGKQVTLRQNQVGTRSSEGCHITLIDALVTANLTGDDVFDSEQIQLKVEGQLPLNCWAMQWNQL